MVRVVVAEDFAPLRELLRLRFALAEAIVVVGEAEDGREALEVVAAVQPDVLLLDLAMPGVDGQDAITQMRARHPNVDIVVLTGVATLEARQQALDNGACACLLKTPHAIREVIDTILAVASRRDQAKP